MSTPRTAFASLLAIVASTLGLWSACAASSPASAPGVVQNQNQAADDNDRRDRSRDASHLYVRGAAELEKPADQLQLSIGVVTEDKDASEALAANSTQMHAVIQAVEDAGLSENEYQTGRFQIRPVWSPRPRNADSEWRPRIIGYNVTNTVNVKTKQLRIAGELIEAANRAGANSIDAIQFTLADQRTHRAEAIAVATANARSDAEALAEAAGVRLVRVVEVRLDDAQPITPPQPYMYERTMAMEADAAAPPMNPGDVTVRASVNLVYEIAPMES